MNGIGEKLRENRPNLEEDDMFNAIHPIVLDVVSYLEDLDPRRKPITKEGSDVDERLVTHSYQLALSGMGSAAVLTGDAGIKDSIMVLRNLFYYGNSYPYNADIVDKLEDFPVVAYGARYRKSYYQDSLRRAMSLAELSGRVGIDKIKTLGSLVESDRSVTNFPVIELTEAEREEIRNIRKKMSSRRMSRGA